MRLALLAALLVACGNDGEATRDAGDGDGNTAVDADIDADPNVRGTVTVKIVDKNDAAIAGMYVVFIDTDSTVTERMTDSAGMAQADVYPNATVTAVRQRDVSFALATVQALNPGDTITLISASPDVSSSQDPFSQRVVPMRSADIAATPNGATKAGTTATFTTLATHGFVVGDSVIVTNIKPVDAYNGNWTVASVPSPTTFTVTIPGGALLPAGSQGGVSAIASNGVPFTISYGAYAGAQNYQVRTRCGTIDVATTTSPALVLPAECATSPQDIEVIAETNAGATLAWTQQANVNITAGGSTTITDSWHTPADLSLAYSNATPEITSINVTRFSPYARGLPVGQVMQSTAGNFTMPGVSYPSRASMVSSFIGPSSGAGTSTQRIAQEVNGTAGQLTHDIGADVLPWVKAVRVAGTATIDITVIGSDTYDIAEMNHQYIRGQSIYVWRVFGPFAEALKLPTLPATAPGDPTLRPTDGMSNTQAFIGESDAINGYRAAIKNPFEALGTCEASTNANVRLFGGTKNRISQWN